MMQKASAILKSLVSVAAADISFTMFDTHNISSTFSQPAYAPRRC